MLRYYIKDGYIKSFDFKPDLPKIKYDKIVDKSQFRQDSDNIRQFVSNGVGSSGSGTYDDPKNMPSDLEVRIRSGKLDKAEISQLQLSEIEKLKKLDADQKKAAEKDKLDKIDAARQAYLDKKTGFTGSPQTN